MFLSFTYPLSEQATASKSMTFHSRRGVNHGGRRSHGRRINVEREEQKLSRELGRLGPGRQEVPQPDRVLAGRLKIRNFTF